MHHKSRSNVTNKSFVVVLSGVERYDCLYKSVSKEDGEVFVLPYLEQWYNSSITSTRLPKAQIKSACFVYVLMDND